MSGYTLYKVHTIICNLYADFQLKFRIYETECNINTIQYNKIILLIRYLIFIIHILSGGNPTENWCTKCCIP